MTNLEKLTSITPFSGNSQLLIGILIDNGISEDEEYVAANKAQIDICAAYAVKYILISADFKEGSLSVDYDRKELINFANTIFKENGLTKQIIRKNKINII